MDSPSREKWKGMNRILDESKTEDPLDLDNVNLIYKEVRGLLRDSTVSNLTQNE